MKLREGMMSVRKSSLYENYYKELRLVDHQLSELNTLRQWSKHHKNRSSSDYMTSNPHSLLCHAVLDQQNQSQASADDLIDLSPDAVTLSTCHIKLINQTEIN
ncbi:hypothetical protein PAAG_12667 [Paracoccidioides lutzii Pb01]|uniref:Uncharacterized protein n=1 Tax=Paracoccidioides lutzii (strain ATCC MYA-826 / Pb01) TaxID=502779 RepID=A0A0A2V3I9_PARBA|nr:hypothetical protein PAAG_12667 [Paracoccidioides lutzii Pb01]KGQ00670.1 hypothetical protein PAAG_12667 [Paracoccidioides lutzii Pb01]